MQSVNINGLAAIVAGSIGAAATLIAVLITQIFARSLTKLNLNAQQRQRFQELKLQKLEELFFLFEKWQTHFSIVYLTHLSCYRGQLTYRQVLEMTKEPTVLAPGEAQKYKVLLAVYFPSLQAKYSLVEEARKQIAPFLSDPRESRLSAQAFATAQETFEKACAEFKCFISSVVQMQGGDTEDTMEHRTCVRPIETAALVVALFAAGFSGLQWYEARDQRLLAAHAAVTFVVDADATQKPLGVAIKNAGPGVAEIHSITYYVNRKKVKDLDEAFTTMHLDPNHNFGYQIDEDEPLGPSELLPLIDYRTKDKNELARAGDFIDTALAVEVTVCVRTGQCWPKCSYKDHCGK